MAIQIDCIEKHDRNDPTTAIERIGGRNVDGTRWSLTLGEAISGIKRGRWSFFVFANNRRVNVIVAVSRYGNEYLKTEADDYLPNNLLSLQNCHWAA